MSISVADRRRAVAAGGIGNFVEWFDFIAYGALAVIIAPHFFPSDNPTASLLSTFAAFAVAFVCRPIGGVVWGYIGDRWGRRSALSSAVLTMSAATVVIGSLPTAASIGVLAPIFLVLCRCIQGLAAGAEWSGSAVFLVEYGDKKRRALFASLTPVGAQLGAMVGVALVAALNATLGSEAVESWAWRIPFLLAGPLGLVGFYIRLRLDDTPAFTKMKSENVIEKAPIREALRTHRKQIFILFVMAAAQNTATYSMVAFMVTYLRTDVGVSLGVALFTNTLALGVGAVTIIMGGIYADRHGRRPVYLWSVGLLILAAVPMYMLIGRGDMFSLIVGQSVLAALIGGMLAPIAASCVELFPARVRYAASAMGYSLGAGVIGGAAPLIATALIASSGQILAPAFYLTAILLIAFVIVAKLLPETKDLPLELEETAVLPDVVAPRISGVV
ncbi:MFS transporter [Rhodococcus opacus]|uniref:MFS transporter n=1 Tax=Rhodococcus opacus TaxID=37919 RepID=UPI00146D3CFF|nr:MFS transporter [Rhodococcus opacus]MDV7088985.1 MFS transporter [Rhodococcus opacus]WKN60271.1 MFS transporter [Rhodococcus opacus]